MFKILVYHLIDTIPNKNPIQERMYVSIDSFIDQMDYLKKNDYNILSLDKAEEYILSGQNKADWDNSKNILLTFDDGYKNTIDVVMPILVDFHFAATLCICGSYINKGTRKHTFFHVNRSFAETSDIKLWLDKGNSLLPHTYSHMNLCATLDEDIESEFHKDLEVFKKEFNMVPRGIVYPFGRINDKVVEIASKYYSYGLVTDMDYHHIADQKYCLNRICIEGTHTIDSFIELLM